MVLAQDFRNAVLQAAIQGKLTKQLESDSKVSDLLKNVENHREPLKTCKHGLNLESMNIKIPCSWKMVELNSILSFVDYRGKTPNKSIEGIFLITASNIKKGYMDYTRKEYISKKEYDERQSRGITKKGDLLFTTEAPLGNVALCDLEVSSCGQRVITMQAYCENTVCSKLFMYFLLSPAFQKELTDNCTGTTAKGIKAEKLKHLLVPLPPIEEQHRIVDRVNELMVKIDDYEKVEKELVNLENKFPVDMKNALLQAAMQGRLTEQLDSDSSVDEILELIKEEKKQLIKEKKIKREKALSPIEENDIPFEIPENWRWERFANIVILNPRNNLDDTLKVSFIPMTLIRDGYNNEHLTENRTWKDVKKGFTHIKEGDIGIAKITPCFQNRKSVIFKNLANGYAAGTTELHIIRTIPNSLLPEYLLWFVKSPYFIDGGVNTYTGTAGQQRIHKEYLPNCLVPVPPIEEQKRIVERLEQLLPLCDTL